MKHTLKEWYGATRNWTFPITSVPVVATCAYLMWRGYEIRWLCAILFLVGGVIFLAAGNLISDWWDYRKGVDTEDAYAVPNLVYHQFAPKEYMGFSVILFVVGTAIILILTLLCGWLVLAFGCIGTLLAVTYSFFKYRAMGELVAIISFGVLPVICTSFFAIGFIDWHTLVLALPFGIFSIAGMHDNNTVDIETDKAAGIITLAMRIGERASVVLYLVYLVLPYFFVILFCIIGLMPIASLVCMLSIPMAYRIAHTAYGYFSKGREAMLGLDRQTAYLLLLFGLLLSVGIFLQPL